MKLTGKEDFLTVSKTSDTSEEIEVPFPFIVAVDTREQMPFTFSDLHQNLKRLRVYKNVQTLKTGDYSIVGFENRVCVERKSKQDLFGSVSSGRDRFERELGRMSKMERACVVVECSMQSVKQGLEQSQMDPMNVLFTMISWAGRYRVPWMFCETRGEAEFFALKFLDFAWREFVNGRKTAGS